MTDSKSKPRSIDVIISEVLRSEADTLGRLAGNIPENSQRAVQLIFDCRGRVIVTGMGKMSAVARKFSAMLCSTGTPATFLHPAEAHHGDLGMVTSNDLIVALSNSGETTEIIALVPFAKRHGVHVIAITGTGNNSLARVADCAIALGVQREADEITDAPTNSTIAAMAMCDALAIALVHKRGFTREQFAQFHPGGQLGRKLLLTVSDMMHRDDRLPLIDRSASLRQAIVVISNKGLGAGLICDSNQKLLGILTDGDLRRLLERNENPLAMPVVEAMNASPIRIDSGRLGVEALNLMRERSVTVLPVVDDCDKVVGAIHLHDLLRAGLG